MDPVLRRERLAGGAELTMTASGLWLVDGERRVDLLAPDAMHYERGRLRDRIVVGGAAIGVPPGRRAAVRALVAAALARGRSEGAATVPSPDRYLDLASDVESVWLGATLVEGERLLAWLGTPVRFLLTSERAALVEIGELGEVSVRGLASLRIAEEGRAGLRCGDVVWTTKGNAHGRILELAYATELAGARRLVEVSRQLYVNRNAERAREILAIAEAAGEAQAALALVLVGGEARDLPRAILALRAADASPRLAAQLFTSHRCGVPDGRLLLARLRAIAAEPFAIELHRRIRLTILEAEPSLEAAAACDAEWAAHLLGAGDRSAAQSVVDARLATLPEATVEDVLPPEDQDLTLGAASELRVARRRLHELSAELTPGAVGPILALARIEPLVPSRLDALAIAAEGDLAARAREARQVLGPGGLAGGRPATLRAAPFGDAIVEGVIRHPLAREGTAIGRLLALLASVEVPDRRALSDYCEALANKSGTAADALRDTALAIGIERAEGYVSRGRRGVGARAYEGDPPFVLLGGRHLDDDEYRLDRAELAFVLGSELLHLRFEHGRVTSDEVWAGAWSKSRQGLDLALGVLPVLKGWRFADRIAAHLGSPTVSALAKGAVRAKDALERRAETNAKDDAHAISARNEELVAAHRVMQLSADRAGLACSGSLAAALRAMFLVRPDYRGELESANRDGLATFLERRAEGGQIAYQDLALRAAWLIAFWLSSEFEQARDAP